MHPDDRILVQELADQLGRHSTKLAGNLKRRGYALVKLRTPSGQWANTIARAEAAPYIAERRAETLRPSISALGVDRTITLAVWTEKREPQIVALDVMTERREPQIVVVKVEKDV